MACGPNRVPGRCEVPPSNGAPRNTTSYPPSPPDPGAASSASSEVRSTPANVMSGPYIPRVISGSAISSRLRLRKGTNSQERRSRPPNGPVTPPQGQPEISQFAGKPSVPGWRPISEARWQAGHRASVSSGGQPLYRARGRVRRFPDSAGPIRSARVSLDDIDARIVTALIRDARASYAVIGDEVG